MPTHSITAETAIRSKSEDLLGYSAEADDLANLLADAQPPSMIGLYSPWGSGKSSMLNLVKESIEEKKRPDVLTIRFDTWDHENFQGLIPSLLLQVGEEVESKAKDRRALSMIKQSFYRVAKVSSIVIAHWGLKAATGGNIGVQDIVEAADLEMHKAQRNTDQVAFDQWKKEINRDPYRMLRKALKEAFDLLKELEISKVIFLIDDLDRCHPENIYNFLDNLRRLVAIVESLDLPNQSQGFVGLICADEEIISSTIKTKYPHASADAGAYLYKLLTMIRRLPPPGKEAIVKLLEERGKREYGLGVSMGAHLVMIVEAASDYAVASEGALTPRHLLAFLRQLAYWYPKMADSEKDALPSCYAPTVGLALLGSLDPAKLRMLVGVAGADLNKLNDLINITLECYTGSNIRGNPKADYAKRCARSFEDDWNGFRYTSFLKKLAEVVNKGQQRADILVAAKLAGLG